MNPIPTNLSLPEVVLNQNYQLQYLHLQLVQATTEIERLKQELRAYENERRHGNVKIVNTSFWSNEEHSRFLLGVEKFGVKNAKEIAKFVGTRTPVQVRSHAQKYFMKVSKHQEKPQSQSATNIVNSPKEKLLPRISGMSSASSEL